jgi:hypothetical protein
MEEQKAQIGNARLGNADKLTILQPQPMLSEANHVRPTRHSSDIEKHCEKTAGADKYMTVRPPLRVASSAQVCHIRIMWCAAGAHALARLRDNGA